eukprot:gene30811-9891_t
MGMSTAPHIGIAVVTQLSDPESNRLVPPEKRPPASFDAGYEPHDTGATHITPQTQRLSQHVGWVEFGDAIRDGLGHRSGPCGWSDADRARIAENIIGAMESADQCPSHCPAVDAGGGGDDGRPPRKPNDGWYTEGGSSCGRIAEACALPDCLCHVFVEDGGDADRARIAENIIGAMESAD